ncbi:TCR/Tet family MFS transporter [Sphingomonas immobilis]|uniref:TCR/Tet family MFS transporter n=1 Tax=Sphingomonas immobilis TaxID=3063997 RepID=A0ABT8ZTL4_9SPHN|nr:TCR/Tet family MFS transporter [Sphingomonas sp. CA1-15]MDO7840909.1 TCR/Tet family MFS transporter [Sphingomonas sp. CA1-15]
MRFEHRAVPIVLSAVLIDTIGFGIVLPVLPSLIMHLAHNTLADAARTGGALLIAFSVAQFFAGPVIGSLGDHFGRRPVLLLAMLAFAIDYALMAFAPTIGWLFLGRVIAGVAGAVYGPANAVIADVTPPEKRGAAFGLMGAAFGVGFIIGPAIGGLLSVFGPRAPFLVAGGLALINAIWIGFVMPETLKPEDQRDFEWKRANAFGAFIPLFNAGGALPLIVTAFFWQICQMVYPSTWAFWCEARWGWSAREVGWSLAATGVMMALTQTLLTGRLIARFGEERTLVIGMVAATAVFIAFNFITAPWMVFPLLAVGTMMGVVFPSLNAVLSRMVDASNQGSLQGGMSSVGSAAAVIGPLMMTQVLASGTEHGVPGAAFLLSAAIALLSLGIVFVGVIRPLRARATVAGGEPPPHL